MNQALLIPPDLSTPAGARLKPRLMARSALSGLPLLGVSLAALAGVALTPLPAKALPQDGVVATGAASIAQTGAASMAIHQASMAAVIDWRSFDIGADETVEVFQPSSMASLMNRVAGGGGASQILGTLQAQGRLTLVNPAGITIGNGARIDVAGLIASTANMSNQDFMLGRGDFTIAGRPDARIVNAGGISIRDGGLAALVAPGVENSGVITARLGRVQLAAGDTFTLDMYGDDLIRIGVSQSTLSSILNTGRISADGGVIEITAGSGAAAVDSLINVGGVVEARSAGVENGAVVFYGAGDGVVNVSGNVDVSGRNAGETGGTIKVLGDRVALTGSARLDASGDADGGTILVGGDYQGKGATPTASRTYVGRDATINTSAINTGNAGTAVVWADGDTRYYGSISARGGAQSGNGGTVEVSGKQNLGFDGYVDTSASNGTGGSLLLDPEFIVIKDGGTAADDDEFTSDGTILFNDPDGPLGLTFNISENAIEGLTATSFLTLQATNKITIEDLADNTLSIGLSGLVSFEAGAGGIIAQDINDEIKLTGGGSLTLDASMGATGIGIIDLGKITLGAGTLTLKGSEVIINPAGVSTTGGNIGITAVDVSINGTVDAGGGPVFITNTTGTAQIGANPGVDMNISAAELANITASNLTISSPATLTIDGVSAEDTGGIGELVFVTGNSDIFFSGGASAFNLLKVLAGQNITISTGLTVNGLVAEGDPSLYLYADNDASGSGILTVDNAIVEATKHGAFMQIRAADLNIDDAGFLKVPTGFGGIGVNVQQAGKTIGIGAATGDMTISNLELSHMTGVQFDISGEGVSHTTLIDGVTLADTANIGGLFGLYGGPVTFSGTMSSFNGTLFSNEVIDFAADLTVGDFTFNGPVNVDGLRTLTSTNGGKFAGAVDGVGDTHSLTVTATSGEVNFVGAVGATHALHLLDVTAPDIKLLNGVTTDGNQTYTATSVTTVFLNGIFDLSTGDFTVNGNTKLTGDTGIFASAGSVTMGPVNGFSNLDIHGQTGLTLGPLGYIEFGTQLDAVTLRAGVLTESAGSLPVGSALSPLFVNAVVSLSLQVSTATLDGDGFIGDAAISKANVKFNDAFNVDPPSLTITGAPPPPPGVITVFFTDLIADVDRTGFTGFENLPDTGSGGSNLSPYSFGGLTVIQVGGGTDIWTTCTIAANCSGAHTDTRSWYPSGGDNAYTRITNTDASDFSNFGVKVGSGYSQDTVNYYYDLRLNGAQVLFGTFNAVTSYLGFSGGGFDEVRLIANSSALNIAAIGGSNFNALQIDNIEVSGVAVSPPPPPPPVVEVPPPPPPVVELPPPPAAARG